MSIEMDDSIADGKLAKNMELAVRLLEVLEESPLLVDNLAGCVVWNIVIRDESFNNYNKKHIERNNKPVVRVFWRENEKGELTFVGYDGRS